MVSKTRMNDLVRGHLWAEVKAAVEADPAILAYRDERGRNWLHICCMAKPKGSAEDSIRTADVLIDAGLGIDDAAFTEGEWRATPVWHTICQSNHALTKHLLKRGASPDHSLFAACYNNDLEMIRLLIRHGADLDQVAEEANLVLDAVKFSRFPGAEELLKAGVDPNFRDRKGMTALHYMLKKGSDKAHFEMFVRHGARGDIPDANGATAIAIMRRKRDPDFHRLADRLAANADPA